MKINIQEWKEFKINELFDAQRGKVGIMRDLDDGDTPVIAAAAVDEGIAGYYDVVPTYENKITVSCNGVGCGSTFYHSYPFNLNGDALVLLEKFQMSEMIGLMISGILNTILTKKYSYAEKLSPDKIKEEVIMLPAMPDGEPDWAYMEDYMRGVMADCERRYEMLMKMHTKKTPVDVSGWGEFKVGDLFEIRPTKAYKMNNAELLDDGIYPVVVNSSRDNGVGGYTSQEPTEIGGIITFSDTTDANTIFYQPDAFVGYSHVQSVHPQGEYKDNWSEKSMLFFVTAFRSAALEKGFDYGNKFRRDIASELKVKLPVTVEGDPDWAYMEDYMRDVMEHEAGIIEGLAKIGRG